MCGLYGIYIKNAAELPSTERMRLLITGLAHNNMARGRDSFGLWNSSMETLRQVGMVTKHGAILQGFLDDSFSREKLVDGFWMGGHTRAATHGSICQENTHPFQYSNVILAHNGVVDVDGYDNNDHAVDSGRIAQSIVDHGWVDGIAKVQGSCALITSVHLDGGKTKLYIYRHNQTLWYAILPWGYVISSTKGHLEDSLEIAGLKADSYVEPPVDKLVSPWDNFELSAPAKERVYTPVSYAKGASNVTTHQPNLYTGEDTYVGGCGSGRYSNYRPKDRSFNGGGDRDWSRGDWPKNADSMAVASLIYSGASSSGDAMVQFKRWLVTMSSYRKNERTVDISRDNVTQYCDFCDKKMLATMLSLEEVGDDYLYCCYDKKCKESLKDMRMLYDGYVTGSVKELNKGISKMFNTSYVYDGIIANLINNDKKDKPTRTNKPKSMSRDEQQALIRGLIQEIAAGTSRAKLFFPYACSNILDGELLGDRPDHANNMRLSDIQKFDGETHGVFLD